VRGSDLDPYALRMVLQLNSVPLEFQGSGDDDVEASRGLMSPYQQKHPSLLLPPQQRGFSADACVMARFKGTGSRYNGLCLD
jgi:hypothetical protein